MESSHGNGEDFAFFEFAALVSWQRPAPAADARTPRAATALSRSTAIGGHGVSSCLAGHPA
ncbi:hypothetical protein, partial [Thiococcus pfennigii]|uniref:hypothetical protein n=1 Tax=Thiococcus pfennigii TaxID=1057 RepID=UPI001A90DC79